MAAPAPRLEAYAAAGEEEEGTTKMASAAAAAGTTRGRLDARLAGALEGAVARAKELAAAAQARGGTSGSDDKRAEMDDLVQVLEGIVEASADEDSAEEIGYLGGHVLAAKLLERCMEWEDSRVADLAAEWTSVTLATLGTLIRDAPIGALDDRPRPFVVHLDADVAVILREVRDDYNEAAHGDKVNVRVGYKLWGGAVVLGTALVGMGAAGELRGKRVLELGAGLGLCGLVAARSAYGAAQVTLTDFHPRIVRNLAYNAEVNGLGRDRCCAQVLDWEDLDSAFGVGEGDVEGETGEGETFDLIIGSDIVCQALDCELVGRVLKRLLSSDGMALVTLGSAESRFGVESFAQTMETAGLDCRETELAVPEVCLPAAEGSDARGEVFLGTARAYVSFEVRLQALG